ncbi:MAG TPA: hypothetical protein VN176_17775 [Verrucomicrobiae bacterium]|jgi:hypothetical protein|nr:hypothetical protein [Verrucomicrobiae bacterium]
MSKINGDKARVNRKRRSKQKLRVKIRALRLDFEKKPERKPVVKKTAAVSA